MYELISHLRPFRRKWEEVWEEGGVAGRNKKEVGGG